MGGYLTYTQRDVAAEDVSDDDAEQDDDVLFNWDGVGRRAMARSRRIPACWDLFRLSKRNTCADRARLVKHASVEATPQELTAPEGDIARAENYTTKNVVLMASVLGDAIGRINLFELVINPESFAQSVENTFHLSFLLRDANAVFEIDSRGTLQLSGRHMPAAL